MTAEKDFNKIVGITGVVNKAILPQIKPEMMDKLNFNVDKFLNNFVTLGAIQRVAEDKQGKYKGELNGECEIIFYDKNGNV